MILQRLLESAGAVTQSYSGRGMMGRSCLAITGTMAGCMHAIIVAAREVPYPKTSQDADMVAGMIATLTEWKTDNLGHDVVVYWPDVKYIESKIEAIDPSQVESSRLYLVKIYCPEGNSESLEEVLDDMNLRLPCEYTTFPNESIDLSRWLLDTSFIGQFIERSDDS